MANIQIVKLKPEEWPLYKEIRLEAVRLEPQAFAVSHAETLQKPDSLWQRRVLAAQAGENNWLLFARENDRLVGMIGAYIPGENDVVEIASVYVTKEKRGSGVGAALMAAILEEVGPGHRFRKAVLSVNKEQAAAVALYRKFGFQIVGEKSGVQGDGLLHTGYVMEKELRVG